MPWKINVLADWGCKNAMRARKDIDLVELEPILQESMLISKNNMVAAFLQLAVFKDQLDELIELIFTCFRDLTYNLSSVKYCGCSF